MVGYDMTATATKRLFEKTPYKPTDVDVIELHDCFSANELITYEALGLCGPGKVRIKLLKILYLKKEEKIQTNFCSKPQAGELVDRGDNTYGGQYVINPSGGLISKGHPLGATGKLTFDPFISYLLVLSF